MPLRRKKIHDTVQSLLDENSVRKPPIPVEPIARSKGARIYRKSLEGEISGFLHSDPERPVIGVNTHHALVRQRFTIAHELGHLLLHKRGQLHVDHQFKIRLRDGMSSQGVDESEMEANLFAAELLMPSSFIEADVDGVDLLDAGWIDKIAKKYRVSAQALLIRLSSLGFVIQ